MKATNSTVPQLVASMTLEDARDALTAAAEAVADARQTKASQGNHELRSCLIVAKEAIGWARRLVHEARGERRDLLGRVAQLECDVEYWRQAAQKRFAS